MFRMQRTWTSQERVSQLFEREGQGVCHYSDSSSSDSNESCDGKGNFSTFMTIAHVESSDDLSVLVEELGEHTEVE